LASIPNLTCRKKISSDGTDYFFAGQAILGSARKGESDASFGLIVLKKSA
jgi:hypothetical protein